MRVDRGTFELILNRIRANICKTPTTMEANPLETHRNIVQISARIFFSGYLGSI